MISMTHYVKEENAEPVAQVHKIECDVLVIEDEELMSALLKRYIAGLTSSPEGAKILGTSTKTLYFPTGWDLMYADLSSVKVAVVDILIPKITGSDLIRDFRRRYPKLGFVPISGMATEPMKRSLREVLPQGQVLLSKPLRKEEFSQAFLRAYQYANNAERQPQPSANPTQEVGEALWTAVQNTQDNAVPLVVKRTPLRKRQAS